jgi:hypothetical protein
VGNDGNDDGGDRGAAGGLNQQGRFERIHDDAITELIRVAAVNARFLSTRIES